MTGQRSILFVSAEAAPFSKVGGLGDVAGSLPMALNGADVHVEVISPYYRQTAEQYSKPAIRAYSGRISFAGKKETYNVYRTEYRGVRFWFVDYPPFFQRSGIYTRPDGVGYADNGRRYLFFQWVVTELIRQEILTPQVLHVNDHHTALLPFLCAQTGNPLPSLLTLHNLAYQGHLAPEDVAALPEPEAAALQALAPPGKWVNPLSIGIETATRINTVSPTYARELLSNPNLAGDVAEALRKREADFSGILNGIDTEYWNPATDPHLAANYDQRHLDDKRRNRRALLQRCELNIDDRKPVFGSVSRLVESKGFEFILRAVPGLVERDAGLVFLGTGEEKYQQALTAFAEKYPTRVFYCSDFNEPLAHLIEAGADLFLMPSRFEPCGLNQMYSLRYGTLPVVHRTGGLADSVISREQPGGCGFVFTPYRFREFQLALDDGFRCFRDQNFWRKLQVAALQRDFSWERSAQEYKKLYIECWKSGQNHEKT